MMTPETLTAAVCCNKQDTIDHDSGCNSYPVTIRVAVAHDTMNAIRTVSYFSSLQNSTYDVIRSLERQLP